jgi:hypothetical protein
MPVVAYQFDPSLELSASAEAFRDLRRWHDEVVWALRRVLAGDRTTVGAAAATLEAAYESFGQTRGCGG